LVLGESNMRSSSTPAKPLAISLRLGSVVVPPCSLSAGSLKRGSPVVVRRGERGSPRLELELRLCVTEEEGRGRSESKGVVVGRGA
jgi:hypothetical protein